MVKMWISLRIIVRDRIFWLVWNYGIIIAVTPVTMLHFLICVYILCNINPVIILALVYMFDPGVAVRQFRHKNHYLMKVIIMWDHCVWHNTSHTQPTVSLVKIRSEVVSDQECNRVSSSSWSSRILVPG